jgi:hypothetical protein
LPDDGKVKRLPPDHATRTGSRRQYMHHVKLTGGINFIHSGRKYLKCQGLQCITYQ